MSLLLNTLTLVCRLRRREPDPVGLLLNVLTSHAPPGGGPGCQAPSRFTRRKKGKRASWRHGGGLSYHHVLWVIGLGGPVWDPPHAAVPVAKLLTEGPVLGLGVPTAVGVVEGDVEEEGPARGEEGLES